MLDISIHELIQQVKSQVAGFDGVSDASIADRLAVLQQKILVVKYGGNAMTDVELQRCFAHEMALLFAMGIHVVVVHGGGPQIDQMLTRLNKQGEFVQGMRVTDDETIAVVDSVLSGSVQGELVRLMNQQGQRMGVRAVGISGRDGQMVQIKHLVMADVNDPSVTVDIGWVGDVVNVDVDLIQTLVQGEFLPVVSPICAMGVQSYNVNADVIAAKLACALHASKLMLLTNIKGVLDKNQELIAHMNAQSVALCIEDGTLYGGMLPKMDSALQAAQNGVGAVHIVDGREPYAVLRALFTDTPNGTEVTAS